MKDILAIQGREFITPKTIKEICGLSDSGFYAMKRRGMWPKPVRLGHARYYDREEVEARLRRGE